MTRFIFTLTFIFTLPFIPFFSDICLILKPLSDGERNKGLITSAVRHGIAGQRSRDPSCRSKSGIESAVTQSLGFVELRTRTHACVCVCGYAVGSDCCAPCIWQAEWNRLDPSRHAVQHPHSRFSKVGVRRPCAPPATSLPDSACGVLGWLLSRDWTFSQDEFFGQLI